MSPTVMNSANTAAGGPAKTPGRGRKAAAKVITLKLSPSLLAKFAPAVAESVNPSRKQSVSSAASNAATPANAAAEATPQPNGADTTAASTPGATNSSMLAPPPNPGKRKGVPGPKPGMKRTASQMDLNGAPKPRGKPGPKKKQKIGENGEVIQQADKPAAPKLGPKASGGAINANLRALDRTGKPCRRWEKKAFSVKSFTGYMWGTGTYATTRKTTEFAGDVKSDSSSSGEKQTQHSSALQSEKSNSGAAATPNPPVGLVSSPAAPVINASA